MDADVLRYPGESLEGKRAQNDRVLQCSVVDSNGEEIGTVETAWVDTSTEAVEFIGVITSWLSLKVLAVPIARAEIDLDNRVIRLPYTLDLIKQAPRHAQHGTLTKEAKSAIYRHFRTAQSAFRGEPG